MIRRLTVSLFALAAAASCNASAAVRSGQDSPRDFTIRSDVRLVLLDVAVTDHNGRLVPGLARNDFSVTENGIPQAITVFANNDIPVTAGILIDESSSMAPKRAEVLAAAEALIERSNPNDEIFVLNFNDHVTRGLPDGLLFSDDNRQLRSALRNGTPQGRTALNDAIVAGLRQLELGRRDKKTLIVISDGGDNASHITRRAVADWVDRSLATIYTIGIADPDDPDRDPGLLKALARTSGGESYFPNSLADLGKICQSIAKEIRSRYTIGYAPPSGKFGDLRRVRVYASAAGHTGLVARTRARYRYEPIQGESSN
jgi:VWFA-related protein